MSDPHVSKAVGDLRGAVERLATGDDTRAIGSVGPSSWSPPSIATAHELPPELRTRLASPREKAEEAE